MRYRWPEDTAFTRCVLTVEQEVYAHCQRGLNICDHRFHRIFTLAGPVKMVCKLARCPTRACVGHAHTLSALAETHLTLSWWLIGWDVFCWLGHRRFARHWSIPQLQAELRDSFRISLSDDAIRYYLQRYQAMVAARHQDAALLAAVYRDLDSVILTIDGLQPEKGHETLYVVRELRSKRDWFAEASTHRCGVDRLSPRPTACRRAGHRRTPQDHAQGPLHEETLAVVGRLGTTLQERTLAFKRAVEN